MNRKVSSEPLTTPQEQETWKAGHREKEMKGSCATLSAMEILSSDHRSLKRGFFRLFTTLLIGRVEAKALTPECARWFASSMREALQQGIDASLDDLIAIYHQSWGIDLASIRVPVLLWHGEKDQFVRNSEGRWLATRVPKVEARFTPNDGHVSLGEYRIPEVHRWLLAKFKGDNLLRDSPMGPP